MELEGRYVSLWLSDTAARLCFGLEPSGLGQEYRWLLGGKVHGDSPVGLWIKIEHLEAPDGTHSAPPTDPMLIRWEWVTTASVHTEKPKEFRSFRLSGPGA